MPALWKLDVDSAFRRVPLLPAHRWAAAIAFIFAGVVCQLCKAMVATHNACPFGAVSSVHTWERVGAMLSHFGRVLLMLPVYRYVDDFFAFDQ